MPKKKLINYILVGMLSLGMLTVIWYVLLHEMSIQSTIAITFGLMFFVALSVRFYFQKIKAVRTNYQVLFDSSPLAIYVLNKSSLKFLAVNKAMVGLYGYTEIEFLSMDAVAILPENARSSFALNNEILPGQLQEPISAIHQKKDGQQFYVTFNYHAVPMLEQEAILVMVTNIDKTIQDKKQIEELLHLYDIVNKATQDVIWDYHLDEDQLYWMQGFEETYGYSKEESPDKFWTMEKVHESDRQRIIEAYEQTIANGKREWVIEYRYICADGSHKYVREHGNVVFDENGKPVRLIGAMQDIDKQVKYEKRLLDQNKQLKEIAWTNSHGVRKPLSNIIGLIDLIKDTEGQSGETKVLIDLLSTSSKELDDAVILINKQIIEDE